MLNWCADAGGLLVATGGLRVMASSSEPAVHCSLFSKEFHQKTFFGKKRIIGDEEE